MTNNNLVDKAGNIREGEELDLDRLRQHLEPVLGAKVSDLQVRQFPGGHSNLTYLLNSGDEQWVLRRPPFGSTVKSAHDMSREYKILSALKDVYPYSPVPSHFCDDHDVIGCDFYLMSYIEGLVIRRDYPKDLVLSPEQIRQQLFNFFDVLSELHSVDLVEAGLDTFGRPEGYVKRQMDGWCRRWEDAVTPDTVNCDNIIKWLQDNMPAESGKASVIHNDYKMDNVIFSLDDPLKVIGVLDWEMSTVGDPLMDLGCTLGYWTQISDPDFFRESRTMPSDIPGAPTRAEIISRFQQQTGIAVDNFPFYFCFGLFRLAVIGQQIYYRYYHGLTKDERFAGFIKKSHVLHQMCELIISGKIES
ncbi:MAG: phosphotransferase family protein [Gammaproteobacteria bacterium]|nr:phosphotransferase family protein [Gammaproteobacteria bacterium]MBT3859708.1 phosphotransferase family protein [Gammaproteobacteria bacterium]MBT3987229.1 phosphotransferase family protein [Gammaproteobacteria bacterium]MBT4256221.1 phosphotransferase family protein [Gammaproteobacteria bacterium]MBT4581579.1 phosphotransferase family protein [Gammaproteobacteria bacterium]